MFVVTVVAAVAGVVDPATTFAPEISATFCFDLQDVV